MSQQSLNAKEVYGPFLGNRWIQLAAAVIAMIMIANLQYAWTLFTTPLTKSLNEKLSNIQYAFTLFIMFETFVQPVGGLLLDKFGSRLMFTLAGLFVGAGWSMLGQVHTVSGLYFFYALAGVGAAIIYGGSISVAVRWFPDKKGLASGLIAAGFGMGSIPFVPIIGNVLKSSGVATAFMSTGIVQGLIVLVMAQILRYPPQYLKQKAQGNEKVPQKQVDPATRGFTPAEMLRTPHFWLIWLMFLSVNIGGLSITANTKPFATKIGISSAAILAAVSFQSLGNGIGRLFWGWVSDKLGRYRTMFVAFGLNAIFLFLLPIVGTTDITYIVIATLVMFTWGEIFSLFPPVNVEVFGTTYSATNYGLLYSSKGFASIFAGGLGAALAASFGWNIVFTVTALFSAFAAIMSLVLPRLPKPVKPGAKSSTPAQSA